MRCGCISPCVQGKILECVTNGGFFYKTVDNKEVPLITTSTSEMINSMLKPNDVILRRLKYDFYIYSNTIHNKTYRVLLRIGLALLFTVPVYIFESSLKFLL